MLYTLIVIMALVMAGLILVQFNSLKQASDIKEAQFEDMAKRAVDLVIYKLEANETMLAQQIVNYMDLNNRATQAENSQIALPGSLNLIYSEQNIFGNYRQELQFSYNKAPGDDNENNRNNIEENQTSFEQLLVQNIMQRRAMESRINYQANLYEKRKIQRRPIEERIDSTVLSSLLKDAMQDCGINLDYKMAVVAFQQGKEKTIVADPGYNPGHRRIITGNLFPRDIDEPQPNYLCVDFPKRSGYLIKTNRDHGYPICDTDRDAYCHFRVHHPDYPQTKETVIDQK